MEKVLPSTDTVLHDHPLTASKRFRNWRRAICFRMLPDFRRAFEAFQDRTFITRTPIVPGVNDDKEQVRGVQAIINEAFGPRNQVAAAPDNI